MEVIAQHDRFFARLIGLIPAELYLHSDSMTGYNAATENSAAAKKEKAVKMATGKQARESDDGDGSDGDAMSEGESGVEVDDSEDDSDNDNEGEEEEAQKYTKKGKAPLSAEERKQRSQENKKRKYAAAEEEESVASSSAKGDAPESSSAGGKSMEDLRKKLQERITQLKTLRQAKKQKSNDGAANKAQQAKNSVNKASKQLKEVIAADVDDESVDSLKNDLAHFVDDDEMSALSLGSAQRYAAEGAVEADIEFSSLLKYDKQKFLAPKESLSKKDGGKTKRLQRLLQEAERKRARLKALTSSGDEALKKKARGEQWNDALESAAGGKPLVVSTTGGISKTELKIKKALKKREKKKSKSAEEWADRLAKVEDDKKLKLAKREDNLAKKKNRADENVKSTIVHDIDNGTAPKKAVAIRKPGETSKDSGSKGNHGGNAQNGQKKKNRAGFEGKKSGGSFLNGK